MNACLRRIHDAAPRTHLFLLSFRANRLHTHRHHRCHAFPCRCFLPGHQTASSSKAPVNMSSSTKSTPAAAVASKSSSSSPTLSVITLNIWGLWLVSKKRSQRVRHLADYLSTSKEDVVLLQEVWVDADAQLLISAGKAAGLVHATHFRSGMFGSGLVTLSRHPIIRHAFWRYAAGGFATSITCGDYYAGKGVGWVRLSTPLGEADVFNTHLHANYCHDYRLPAPDLRRAAAAAAAKLAKGASPAAVSKAAAEAMVRGTGPAPEWAGSRMPDDDDAGVRMCQLMELSEIIDLVTSSGSSSSSTSSSGGRSSSEGRLIVLGGDLNCKPHTLEIDLLRLRLPQLSDAWAAAAVRSSSVVDDSTAAAGRQSGSRVVSSSGDNDDDDDDDADGSSSSSKLLGINPEGFTCHAPGNTFQPRRQVPERIDYVWSNMVTHKAQVTLQLCPSAGGGSSKQQLLSYSDHFAVRAVLSKHAAGGGSGSAGGSGKTSPVGAMKLISNALGQSTGGASAAAAAATTEAAGAAAQGEGASMPMPQKVATAYAAMLLLQEGFESFVNNRRAMLSLGGFILASLIYVAVGLPILWPDLVLTGPAITAAVAAAAAVTVLGLILVLMGAVGDKSQERAIQSGLRLLRVWMEQQGFAALPQQPQQELVARGETERAVAVQQH